MHSVREIEKCLSDRRGLFVGSRPSVSFQVDGSTDETVLKQARSQDYLFLDGQIFLWGNIGLVLKAAVSALHPRSFLLLHVSSEQSGQITHLVQEILSSGDYEFLSQFDEAERIWCVFRLVSQTRASNRYLDNPEETLRLKRYEIADRIHALLSRFPRVKRLLKKALP